MKVFNIQQDVEIYLNGECFTIPLRYEIIAESKEEAIQKANFYKSRIITNPTDIKILKDKEEKICTTTERM